MQVESACFYLHHLYIAGNLSQVSGVSIGDRVIVQTDYGTDLPKIYSMAISSCALSSSSKSINLIANGTVNNSLTGFVKLVNTTSNRIAEFEWRVFQVGQDSRIGCYVIHNMYFKYTNAIVNLGFVEVFFGSFAHTLLTLYHRP